MFSLRYLSLLLLSTTCMWLHAMQPDSLRTLEHQVLWEAGYQQLLDTYLTPYNYSGPTFGMQYRTLRPAHFGQGKCQVRANYQLQFASAQFPSHNDKMWAGNFRIQGGVLTRLVTGRHHHFYIGGLVEGMAGFTYAQQNGNNPAQAHLRSSLNLALRHDCHFHLFHRTWQWQNDCDLPLVGLAFSPEFGQSYYEVFGLKHHHNNLIFTQPFNTPTIHFTSLLNIPIRRAKLSLGYAADIEQHQWNGIKYHAWRHLFLIGYVRHLRLLH